MSSTSVPAHLLGGRFEVVRTLGQGAFGRTLLARDSRSGGGARWRSSCSTNAGART